MERGFFYVIALIVRFFVGILSFVPDLIPLVPKVLTCFFKYYMILIK